MNNPAKKDHSLARLLWGAMVILIRTNFGVLAAEYETSTPSGSLDDSTPFRITHLEDAITGTPGIVRPRIRISSLFYGEIMTNVVIQTDLPAPDRESEQELMNPRGGGKAGLPARSSPQYVVDRWTVAEGLPGNKIRSLLQTHDGYLWIGSESGLARFDGVRFTSFTQEDSPEMAANGQVARALFEDDARRLWIGTERGMLSRVGQQFVSFPGQNELSSGRINGFAKRSKGGFWIAADRGVGYWDGTQVHWISTPEESRPFCLAEDGLGKLWIGGMDGLHEYEIDTSRVTRSFRGEQLHGWRGRPANIYGLMIDRQNRLWVGNGIPAE